MFRLLRRGASGFGEAGIFGGALTLAFAGVMLGFGLALPRYSGPPSKLRGAGVLHLPQAEERRYLHLASAIAANCDSLFTLPGMGSLNYWSGVPAPNGFNMTGWVKAFSDRRQQQILDRVRANPRACVVYNRDLSGFWGMTREDEQASLLGRYITREMAAAARYGAYEIRVTPERTAPWVQAEAGQ